ncbi:hypothetical protein K4A83_14965 [Spirulina subsalsa FACHB-351]|uniref:Uncharacterized protein n=1 Tax=Spirulina subsalsa FACHB-351 TaxID=234711 RepID=A0ABT3L7T4_9CYAN|nr:hypothetical protein [Spirulina subsalsa]MCW6037566.1 hypothetical protein [Spirulina subsalsa FACHB-351]
MDIDQQIQRLIDKAPPDGTGVLIQQVIGPVLRAFAAQVQHLEYYVMQSLTQEWVLTTLSNRAQPQQQKKVIYAFATLKDARQFQETPDPSLIAVCLPVTHILFQLLAMEPVDSVVFMDVPKDLSQGKEVKRQDLQNLVTSQMEQVKPAPGKGSRSIPPDLA